MNIISKLKDNNLSFNIKYYGIEDMSTGITVRYLLDGKELILNHYNDHSINDINQYIDYVFLDYIMNFNEVIPYVMEEKQEEFKDFIDNCNLMFKKYEIKNVILYLKDNYLDVYAYKNDDSKMSKSIIFDLKEYTTHLISKNFNSFDENDLHFLIDNETFSIIDDFESWHKFFVKQPDKLKLLFNEENINKVLYMRTAELISIFISLYFNEKFTEIISNASNIISDILKTQFFCHNDQSIWESYYMLNDWLPFYRRISSPFAYELEKELAIQEKIFNEVLEKNGHLQTFNVDLKPFKDFFEDTSKPWEIRIFYLTHSRDESGKLSSFLEQGAKCEVKAISDDLCRNNPGTNEYFNNWRLRNLHFYLLEIKGRISFLMQSKENINEYLSDIYGEIHYICDKMKTTMEFENLDENIDMLSQYLIDIFINMRKNSEQYELSIKNNIYGCSMFICGLIEKILRIIYKNSMKNISYIPDSNITLGNLLAETDKNTSIIFEILGLEQIRCLRYFLHKIDYNYSVGKNIRNDLAHINGSTMKHLNDDLVLELLAFFTSIVNSCILYYQNC